MGKIFAFIQDGLFVFCLSVFMFLQQKFCLFNYRLWKEIALLQAIPIHDEYPASQTNYLKLLVLQHCSRDQGNTWPSWPNHLMQDISRAWAFQ